MIEDKYSTPVKPVEVHLHSQQKSLEISFEDGKVFHLSAEYLRVQSPDAKTQGHRHGHGQGHGQGHGTGPGKLIAGRKFVGIINVEPVGHYALKIIFDDLHDLGFYSWRYLYQLGEEYETRWAQYLAALEAAGKHREPDQGSHK